MRSWLILLAAALTSCSHKGSVVARTEGEDFSRYHRVGVLPFSDPRGQGAIISGEIDRGLAKLMYDKVDTNALEKVLGKYRLDRGEGLNVEALMDVHQHAPADAIVFGAMAPDWCAARLTMVETEMGATVLRAVLKPKKTKCFFSADDVAREALRVLTSPR